MARTHACQRTGGRGGRGGSRVRPECAIIGQPFPSEPPVVYVPRSRHVRLATLTLFLVQSTACTTTVHTPLAQAVKPEKITGVTLKSGRNVPFNPAGAEISGNALYANGPDGQIVIPTDSVADVWTKQFSATKTVGVCLAVVAVLGLFYVVANKTSGSASGPGY